MKPLCSGINVSINAGSNARTSPDLPDQQKQLTGRSQWTVHETKKSAYSTGFVQDNDLKAGEALLVQFMWNGELQTVLHLDRDETSDEDTVEYGYDAGEAVWNLFHDRLINLTGIIGMPDFTNGQSIDGFFI